MTEFDKLGIPMVLDTESVLIKMTDLRKQVQMCGQHTCDCKTCSISPKEAQHAIDVIKLACIDAVTKCDYSWIDGDGGGKETMIGLDDAIETIKNVK